MQDPNPQLFSMARPGSMGLASKSAQRGDAFQCGPVRQHKDAGSADTGTFNTQTQTNYHVDKASLVVGDKRDPRAMDGEILLQRCAGLLPLAVQIGRMQVSSMVFRSTDNGRMDEVLDDGTTNEITGAGHFFVEAIFAKTEQCHLKDLDSMVLADKNDPLPKGVEMVFQRCSEGGCRNDAFLRLLLEINEALPERLAQSKCYVWETGLLSIERSACSDLSAQDTQALSITALVEWEGVRWVGIFQMCCNRPEIPATGQTEGALAVLTPIRSVRRGDVDQSAKAQSSLKAAASVRSELLT